MTRVEIDSELAGKRLDLAIAAKLDKSRSFVNRLLTANQITGEPPIKASRKVRVGELFLVDLSLPLEKEAKHTVVNIKKQLLFEDDHILVINKLVGQVVHPGPGQRQGTIAQVAGEYCPAIRDAYSTATNDQLAIAKARAGIVHRLDKDTSGVLIIAKTAAALANLQAQFAARTVRKQYNFISAGIIKDVTIDEPIGRHPKLRFLRAALQDGRAAVTKIHPLQIINTDSGPLTLGQATPLTGRTHQIRVHLKWLGHPILGDRLYFSKTSRAFTEQLSVKRLLLHAAAITIKQPMAQTEQTFTAPLPNDFSTVINSTS